MVKSKGQPAAAAVRGAETAGVPPEAHPLGWLDRGWAALCGGGAGGCGGAQRRLGVQRQVKGWAREAPSPLPAAWDLPRVQAVGAGQVMKTLQKPNTSSFNRCFLGQHPRPPQF